MNIYIVIAIDCFLIIAAIIYYYIKNKPKYKVLGYVVICTDDKDEFESRVLEELKMGWDFVGEDSFIVNEGIYFQPMILIGKE